MEDCPLCGGKIPNGLHLQEIIRTVLKINDTDPITILTIRFSQKKSVLCPACGTESRHIKDNEYQYPDCSFGFIFPNKEGK